MNYNCPAAGVQDHGIKFDMDLLKSLQDNVQEWGMYLFFDQFKPC
jgi:hypothetical protein